MIGLRDLTESDAAALDELQRCCYPRELWDESGMAVSRAIGAFDGDALVGAVTVRRVADALQISIEVAPSHRGRCIGSALLRAAIERYPGERIIAWVLDTSVAWALRSGAAPTGRTRSVEGHRAWEVALPPAMEPISGAGAARRVAAVLREAAAAMPRRDDPECLIRDLLALLPRRCAVCKRAATRSAVPFVEVTYFCDSHSFDVTRSGTATVKELDEASLVRRCDGFLAGEEMEA